MLTGVTSTNNSTTTNGAAASTTANTMDQAQDRFLKLLVAQLNNQDPMNPLDNAQMTSQMAQINTVTGIQQVNETLKGMAAQFTALQVLQGSNMVGHDVLVQSNTLTLKDGRAEGAIDLAARAESVKVDILSPGGQVVDTLNLGALPAGRSNFSWDASAYTAGGTPSYRISASTGGKAVEASALARATVQSVSSEGGTLKVQLLGRGSVSYDSIQAIL